MTTFLLSMAFLMTWTLALLWLLLHYGLAYEEKKDRREASKLFNSFFPAKNKDLN